MANLHLNERSRTLVKLPRTTALPVLECDFLERVRREHEGVAASNLCIAQCVAVLSMSHLGIDALPSKRKKHLAVDRIRVGTANPSILSGIASGANTGRF